MVKMTKDKQISLLLNENNQLKKKCEIADGIIAATKLAMNDFECQQPDSPWPFQREYKKHVDKSDYDAPFMSESCLYPLLHKDQARTVLAIWNRVKMAIGMEIQ